MKTWGSGGIAPLFLTSALDEGEWFASRPCRFTPGERAPGTHWIGGCVGPRAGLDCRIWRRISRNMKSVPRRGLRQVTAGSRSVENLFWSKNWRPEGPTHGADDPQRRRPPTHCTYFSGLLVYSSVLVRPLCFGDARFDSRPTHRL
jgi:hypothetical protein